MGWVWPSPAHDRLHGGTIGVRSAGKMKPAQLSFTICRSCRCSRVRDSRSRITNSVLSAGRGLRRRRTLQLHWRKKSGSRGINGYFQLRWIFSRGTQQPGLSSWTFTLVAERGSGLVQLIKTYLAHAYSVSFYNFAEDQSAG
jgi:hypothetical protein